MQLDVLEKLGVGNGSPLRYLGGLLVHNGHPECRPCGVRPSAGLENGEMGLESGRGRHMKPLRSSRWEDVLSKAEEASGCRNPSLPKVFIYRVAEVDNLATESSRVVDGSKSTIAYSPGQVREYETIHLQKTGVI